jgi:nitroreductase
MMDYTRLITLMRDRRSVRRFVERPVSQPDIERLLEAARWAPSNHNRQAWRFWVMQNKSNIAALANSVANELAVRLKSLPSVAAEYADDLMRHATFFAQSPALIVAMHKRPPAVSASLLCGLSNATLISGEPLSVAMAVQNLLLAAETLRLGACVMTAPLIASEAISSYIKIPPGFEVTCLIALGYPAETPPLPRRKRLEQIVDYDRASNL